MDGKDKVVGTYHGSDLGCSQSFRGSRNRIHLDSHNRRGILNAGMNIFHIVPGDQLIYNLIADLLQLIVLGSL